MTLKQAKARGFTIVELLIVIVVIAILAAITIVAYNGIQNRAKASAAQSLANTIVKKAEAWNTIQSGYPTYCQFMTNSLAPTGTAPACTAGGTTGAAEAKLDDNTVIRNDAPTDEKKVYYKVCTTPANSAQVQYYDAAAVAVKFIGLAGASSSANCA